MLPREGERRADPTVIGVDWSKGGWVAAALQGESDVQVMIGADLGDLIARVPNVVCIGIDMPIGLPETVRECDVLARKYVRPRHNSVFVTPPASVLHAATYEKANRNALQLLGKKISKQAYALASNVGKVSALAERDDRMIEVHPEVSFRALIDEPVPWPKTTWNGQYLRRAALERAGIACPQQLEEAGGVPVADVLDAMVAAWSARRYVDGYAQSLPAGSPPGTQAVIWY